MTSSLVGSEMCIRDSNNTKQTSHGMGWRLSEGAASKQPRGCRAKRPVSYTHLTLPTICSV
eukprot:4136309-Prorocentrum_lima.AAC.1